MKTESSKRVISFVAWMNRPVMRVQVFTWGMAGRSIGENGLRFFRCLPAYRDEAAKAARLTIARKVKELRTANKIQLPKYDEGKAQFV